MTSIAKIFRRVTGDEVRREQLAEADRMQVEHQAAAELHAGLAAVYRMRSERLHRELDRPTAQVMRAVK